MRAQNIPIYKNVLGRFRERLVKLIAKYELKNISGFPLCGVLKNHFAFICHLGGAHCKIQTAQGTNKNSPTLLEIVFSQLSVQ